MRSRLTASDPDSRRRILRRLAETRAWLGVPERYATAWSDRYYEAANRLAHLRWFHQVLGEHAWLADLCVIDDREHPTSREEWDVQLAVIEREMGLDGRSIAGHARIFPPAGLREELLAPGTESEGPLPFAVSPFLDRGNYAWPHVLEPMAWSEYFAGGEIGVVLRVEWTLGTGWQVWRLRHVTGSPPRWGAQFEHDRLLRQSDTLSGLVANSAIPAEAAALYPVLCDLLTMASRKGVDRLLLDNSPGNLGMDSTLKIIAMRRDGAPQDLATTLTTTQDDRGVLVITERSVEETLSEAVEALRHLPG
jgi:hypothetical protein